MRLLLINHCGKQVSLLAWLASCARCMRDGSLMHAVDNCVARELSRREFGSAWECVPEPDAKELAERFEL